MLPHAFERLNRRTLLSPAAILTTAGIASLLLVFADVAGDPAISLASLYSFGVLLAFTAAQVAVLRLRRTEPGLTRPFRAPGMPYTAYGGAAATAAVWVLSIATHGAARIIGPLWVLGGLVLFFVVRRSRGESVLEHVRPAEADIVPSVEGEYSHILVPVKLGPIGDEVMATAIRLAEELGAKITALHVIRVPLDRPLEAELFDEEERAESSLAEAKILASEHGVTVEGVIVRARAIGQAVVEEAEERAVDLIMMGSSPRWRRQSRFFSPTVDYVLRKAPCEVMVIVYPQGVLDDEDAPAPAAGATLSV
jgi:APA family basic amino acid/polyamine antiporter